MNSKHSDFEWEPEKDRLNQAKHAISFMVAQYAFSDRNRIILEDVTHSTVNETRYFCLGKIDDRVVTVRFTYRDGRIRIFGAGYWRKGKQIYEERNRI